VFFQLFNVFNARHSLRSAFAHLFDNMWLWAAVALSVVLQIIVIYTPLLQTAFGTTALSTSDWLICIGVGSIVLWLNELKKIILRGIARGGKAQWISNSEMS